MPGARVAERCPCCSRVSSHALGRHPDAATRGDIMTVVRTPGAGSDTTTATEQLCWTAPGDDWAVGTAARYELRAFSQRPTPESFAAGTPLAGAPAPAPAGTRQCATVAPGAGTGWLGLRAIDHSGLVGLPGAIALG